MDKNYKKMEKIIEEISKITTEEHLIRYISQNIPDELLSDEEFSSKLKAANFRVKNILEIFYGQEEEKLLSQIEEKGLKQIIEDDESIVSKIPRKYREELFDLAKEFEIEEDFDKAKLLYDKIIKFGNTAVAKFHSRYKEHAKISVKETIYYKAKCSYYACKMKNGEPLTREDEEQLDNLAKEDKENILNLRKPGILSKYERYIACFDDINVEQLENEILPLIARKGNNISRVPTYNFPVDREYSENLSPEKRFQFIKDNFKIKSVKSGAGKYTGTFIFEMEDSDVVIVEKFFDTQGRGTNKTIVPSYSRATYIVHKDADIDLEKESHNVLVEKKRSEQSQNEFPLIESCNHTGEYYERIKEKFNRVENNARKRSEYSNIEILDEETELEENDDIYGDDSEDNNSSNIEKELSEYTLEELIQERIKVNSEFEEFKEKKEFLDKQIEGIRIEIEELSKEITENFKNLTPELKSVIEKEVKTLSEAKEKLKQIKKMRENITEMEKENRSRAEKLDKEFERFLGGE